MSAATEGIPISISYFFVSVSTTTVTGTFIPSKSFVLSLIALITSIMLTPRGPNAGPNGGPADAPPPVTSADTFCSPIFYLLYTKNLILTKPHLIVSDSLRLL